MTPLTNINALSFLSVMSLALSRSRRLVFSGSNDESVRVWLLHVSYVVFFFGAFWLLVSLPWPIQDIRSLVFVCARVNHPFITPAHLHYPHYCNTIARLVRNTRPPPDPLWLCHTPYHICNYNIMYRLIITPPPKLTSPLFTSSVSCR